MSLRSPDRHRKPVSCPGLKPSPWRSRVFYVLLGITAGALAHHSLSDSKKTEKPVESSHEASNSSRGPSESEKELAGKLKECKSGLSAQSLKIHDLRVALEDGQGFLTGAPKPEEANENSIVTGEDLIAASESDSYLTELLGGVGVIKSFEEEKHALVVRDIPIIWLRNEASKIDMPDDAKRSLESLFGAVADYQARPGDLTSRCDMTVALETIENSLDENAMNAMHSSTMLNMLLKSVKQPGINMEDLRNDFCDE